MQKAKSKILNVKCDRAGLKRLDFTFQRLSQI
jgi:hypothetical protein